MKLIEKYRKYRESPTGLIILSIISIIAGSGLLFTPETTPNLIIQGVGILWILEGITYYIEYKSKKK